MIRKNQLWVATLVASGFVFYSMSLAATDSLAPTPDDTSTEEVNEGAQTSDERLTILEEQIIALADMATSTSSPIEADDSSIARGRALYAKRCASCHGSRGQGGGAMSRVVKNMQNLSDPSMWDRDDEMIFAVITNGAPKMPAFRNLKEEDRWHLVNYIRTFSPKPQGN